MNQVTEKDLFETIGRFYMEFKNLQDFVTQLQQSIQEKEKMILDLRRANDKQGEEDSNS